MTFCFQGKKKTDFVFVFGMVVRSGRFCWCRMLPGDCHFHHLTCMQEKMVKNIIHSIIQVRLQRGSDWYLNLDLIFCCWWEREIGKLSLQCGIEIDYLHKLRYFRYIVIQDSETWMSLKPKSYFSYIYDSRQLYMKIRYPSHIVFFNCWIDEISF